ncbi:DUF4235 domain-containing protein, partial [Actinosynnema sp.]|uniref:DUF4235 domain-containing protein n=1 Tax=Actinosynnema sp. TaxID=1872144 RepID=UPI003F85F17F
MAGKLVYRGFSTGVSLLGGYLAGKVFGQVWKLISGDRMAPEPTQRDRRERPGRVAGLHCLSGKLHQVRGSCATAGSARAERRATTSLPGEPVGPVARVPPAAIGRGDRIRGGA